MELILLMITSLLSAQVFAATVALDGTWYTGSNNGTPSLTNPDSNSFNWGTAGSATETAQAGGLWSYFAPISLANDGDSITLSFTVTPGQTATAQSLRFGLFNSGGSKVEKNLSGSNSDDGFLNTLGYFATWNQTGDLNALLHARTAGKTNPLSSTSDVVEMTSAPVSVVLTQNVSYDMIFSVTRNSATEYLVTSTIGGSSISGTTTNINATSFDMVSFLNTPNGIDSFSFSNLQINYSPAFTPDYINFNDYTILSYGGNQDVEGTAVIEDDGASLHLTGNVWKCIELPLTITQGTVLEFDFQSSVEGEEHSLGMDIDLDIQPENRFKLYGTQGENDATIIIDFKDYASYAPNTRHYIIQIGRYYTGSMQYLFFVNDHDAASPAGESVFSNVLIHDSGEYPPQPAYGPQPADNTSDVLFAAELSLSWSAGSGSDSHDVYFGTDYSGVLNSDANSAEYFKGNQAETVFMPESLVSNTTYYWRIDEINQYGITKGAVWSFTTTDASNYVIDDFEGYYGNSRYAAVPVSGYNLLLQNWQDGTTNGSGSKILDLQEGCIEFSFDNSTLPYYSQVERTFASPADLITGENFRFVSMRYRGGSAVTGLYIKLYNGDPDTGPNETLRINNPDVYQSDDWQEVLFDLSKLAGIDATAVTKIVIGVGEDAPAASALTGSACIDDIKMYVCRDFPAFRSPADINGDCRVNIEDVALLSGYWLTAGYYVDAVDPADSSLVAHYAMNDGVGTAVSDSVNHYDGTVIPTVETTAVWGAADGYEGGCLIFDGTFSVQLPADVFSTVTSDFSVCVWLYSDSQGKTRQVDPVQFAVETSAPESVTWDNSGSDAADYVDKWNHLAFVKNSTQGTLSIYKNGYLVSRSAVSSDPAAGAGVSVVGLEPGGEQYYSGKMDQLRIYDDALTQEEILYLVSGAGSTIYQSGCPVFVPFDPFKDGRIDLSDLAVIAESWNP